MIIVNIILMMQLLARQGDHTKIRNRMKPEEHLVNSKMQREMFKDALLHDPSRDQRNIHVLEDDTG